MTRSPSARTSSTSNRAASTSSLTGCAPSASSKPPDVPRFICADAGSCRARLDPAPDGRGIAHRGLSWGVTREGCGLGGRGGATLDPAHEFRERDGARSIIKIWELWRALKRSAAVSNGALRSCSKSRLGFARRSKRSGVTVLRPAAVCTPAALPSPSSRPLAAIIPSTQEAVPRSRLRNLWLWMAMTPPGILRSNAPYANCVKSLPRACATVRSGGRDALRESRPWRRTASSVPSRGGCG